MTRDQVEWLKYQIEFERLSITEIWYKYKISKSTINRIIKSNQLRSENLKLEKLSYQRRKNNAKLLLWIGTYIHDNHFAFTWRDLRRYIHRKNNVMTPTHIIRKLLKEEFRMSFKKARSRPRMLDVGKYNWSKKLFSIKILKLLPSVKLIINMDEATHGRS